MAQSANPDSDQSFQPNSGINQQVNKSTLGSGMQTNQGNGNTFNQGNNNSFFKNVKFFFITQILPPLDKPAQPQNDAEVPIQPYDDSETKLDNLAAYRTEAINTIITRYSVKNEQLSSQGRKNLNIWRSKLGLLEKEAFDIERDIIQLFETFKVDIEGRIKDYKQSINGIDIDKFTNEIREDFSDFQKLIGLDEKEGQKIISIIYVEVADDFLCKEDLGKAKVFLEEAAKLDKDNPLVYQSFALLYFQEHKYNKALVELNAAKRLFHDEKMEEDEKKIDSFINQIPISSRIIHQIGTVLQMCVKELSKKV